MDASPDSPITPAVTKRSANSGWGDLIAGLSVAGLLIPEAIAYSSIAGLSPEHALVACLAGLIIYALLGRSAFAVVAPTSSSATILASAVAALSTTPALAAHGAAQLSAMLVLLVGLLFVLAAATRIGYLSAFISRPVLRGFAFGLAITIVIKQLPYIAGMSLHGLNAVQTFVQLVQSITQWNPWTVGAGVVAYISLRVLKRLPMLPAAFVIITMGVLATKLLDLPAHGVALVGAIDLVNLHLNWPSLNLPAWLQATEMAVPLVVILFAESWGAIRTLALRHDQSVSPNRELLALGCANLLSGAFQGIPVGAGFSASSANEDAGAQSKLAGLIAAATMAVLLLTAGHWIALLPVPVLAAIVISALTHALNPRPLILLWQLGRDELLAIVAAIVVIALGVLYGMLFAVMLSLVAALRRFSQAQISVLGQMGSSRDFVTTSGHPEATLIEKLLIIRPEEPLFFANAELILARARQLTEERPQTQTIILSLEASADIDSTALEALAEFSIWIHNSGRHLLLARVKDDVRYLLQKSPPLSPSACSYFWSVADAVDQVQRSVTGNA